MSEGMVKLLCVGGPADGQVIEAEPNGYWAGRPRFDGMPDRTIEGEEYRVVEIGYGSSRQDAFGNQIGNLVGGVYAHGPLPEDLRPVWWRMLKAGTVVPTGF